MNNNYSLKQKTICCNSKLLIGIFLLLTGMISSFDSMGQVTVTNPANVGPTPLSGTYTTLALAISDLNTKTTIAGPVTITLDPGNPQTCPSGGYSISAILVGASLANTVTIDGSLNTITTPAPAGAVAALNDAIFKFIGSDFMTLQNFVMNENVANTATLAASNTMVEFGVALLYASATNGCQNITIQNNTITLNRTYQNTFGIYANSTHNATAVTTSATATSATGGNHNLKIYGNTVQNVNNGILVIGPTAAADQNTGLDIGGAGGAQANTITNYGTTGTFSAYANASGTVNGIVIRHSIGYNISFNTITSSVGGTTSTTLNGIQLTAPLTGGTPTTTFTNNINSNNISLQGGGTGTGLVGITCPSGSASATSSINFNSNNFSNFGHTVASATGGCTFITSSAAHLNTSISSNTFTNITLPSTGSVTFISNSITVPAGGNQTINGNAIVTAFNKTGAGGTVTGITTGGSSTTVTQNWNNNNFSNITVTGATTVTIINNTDGGSVNHNIIGNTISNITGGTSAITGIISSFGGANGGNGNLVSGNTISNISSAGAITAISIGSSGTTSTVLNNTISGLSTTGASAVIGITSSAPTSCTILKNTICNLQANNASGTVSGITVAAGTLHTVSNNRIGDLRTPSANASNPLVGLNITGGTTVNAFYNTVNISATSSGALFGSSAISASTTPTLTLNNNIFVNTSTSNGAGLTVAYRRSSITLTSYTATSDRNDFSAPNIFTDGTNTFPALGPGVGTYKNFVAARDANSISENPPFLSTTCGNANFLKVNTAVATGVESGGINIAGITDDFENEVRQGNGGYAGTGTAPDMGADEFNGVPLPLCQGTPAASIINGAAVCIGSGTTLTLSSTYTDIGISYQWQSSTTPGGPYTNMGTAPSQATGSLLVPMYYICTISCSFSGQSFTTIEKEVLINPLPTVTLSPASASYCTPGGTAVALTAGGAVTYTYSPTTGLSPTSGAAVSASPAVNTTYTVTGTDANGCVNTASSGISVANFPVGVTAAASPSTICPGGISTLTSTGVIPLPASQYAFAYDANNGFLDPMGTPTTIVVSGVDDAPMGATAGTSTAGPSVPIGFTFNFEGTNYSHFSASPDGWMTLKNSTAAATSSFTNTMNLSSNVPKISPYWDDLATGLDGNVQMEVTGGAPNRILVVQWFVTIPRLVAGAANSTFQAWLYEGSGLIEFRYGSMGTATGTVSSGLTGATSTNLNSITFSTNTASTTANNAQVPGALPVQNTLYSFTPALPSFSWAPAGDVASSGSQNTPTNPLAATEVFTVTVSNAGCNVTASTTVTIDPLISQPATASTPNCAGSNFTVTANISGGGAPYNYDWSDGVNPPGFYPNAPTITANLPAGTYNFSCAILDACGSSAVSAVQVVVNALPIVSASPSSASICNPGGAAITITASGAATYAWSPITGLTPTSGSPVSANPSATTTYTVTGTDANGCTATASTLINVGSVVTMNSVTAVPNNVCSGGNTVLTANASTPVSAYCASTHASGCSGDDITLVDLNGLNNPTSGCGGTSHYTYFNGGGAQTTTLTQLGGAYSLSVSFGTDGSQFFGAWIDYDQDGAFSASEFLGASTNAGSGGTTSVVFNVPVSALNGLTRMRIVGGNDSPVSAGQACGASSSSFGETQDYDVTIIDGVEKFTYAWSESPANATLVSLGGNPTSATSILVDETYTVVATSAAGCTASGSVLVTAGAPLVCQNIAITTACHNNDFTLTAITTGGGSPYSYIWSDGVNPPGFYPNSPTITANLPAGTYNFTCLVSDGCGQSCPLALQVVVNALPNVSVSPSTSSICNPPGNPVTLDANGASTYSWTPAGSLNASTGSQVIASPAASTTYTVIGTDANGCSSSASAVVNVGLQPSVSILAGPQTVCPGGNTTLTANVQFPSGTYCTAGQTLGSCSSPDEFISNVNFNTINNSSTCAQSLPSGYTDYTSISTTLSPGSYPLTFTNGGPFNGDQGKVWIDFDQNGSFADPGEEFVATTADNITFSASITVPPGVYNGNTRMRVRVTYTGSITSCGTTSYGETEDYTVNITGGVDTYSALWSESPGTTLASNTGNPVTALNINSASTYTVNVTSSAGCTASSSVTVSISQVDDNDVCTTDFCDPGTGTVSHTPISTDDNNACTTDGCDPVTGVFHNPVNTDDNNICTTDGCDPVTGVFHNPVNTDDGDACTTDACDPVTAQITHTPVNTDDNNVCTTDGCDPVTGVFHNPVNTDDGDACTTDGCDPVTGVFHNPVNTDDNNVCTTDGCDPVTGVFHNPVNTDDNNVCTTDGCDPVTGVFHNPVNTDDGDACTTDGCDPVTGVYHNAVNTDDNNVCTTDGCDPVTGVFHNPISTDDGDPCTTDACDPITGVSHTPVNVDDNNVCTTDACNPTTGAITHTAVADGTPGQDDGNACTLDVCVGGNTTHTPVTITGSAVIAKWTFEGITVAAGGSQTPSITVGSPVADVGNQTAGSAFSAFHNSTATAWTTPVGNGSVKSISANNWQVGDYYQFAANTASFTNIIVTFDQTGSGTGPRDFKLQYSLNGTSFTDVLPTYTVLLNGAPTGSWTSGTTNLAYRYTYDLSAITSLNSTYAYFRLRDNGTTAINLTTVASGGTGRVDNFTVSGTLTQNIDDNNVCTADACDPITGISHTPISVDDNDVCTTDACDPITGPSHTPISVDDNDACTTDACDPVTGPSHTPVSTDDSNVCTTDGCDPVTGVYHTPVSSDDSNVCTTDGCDPVTGVYHTPVSTDDSNVCTTDGCDPVTGVYHTPVITDDSNVCTTDGCDPVTGVYHTPISVDDNDVCTTDACDPVNGPSHTPINVDDNNACTADGCDPITGVYHNPIPCGVTLNATMYLEGYYAASNTGLMDNYGTGGCLFLNGISLNPNDADTVEISMMDAVTYALVGTPQLGILQTNGNVSVTFNAPVAAGTSYYIRVKHRSAVQTWSANPVLAAAITTYDFSTAPTQAYGSNMVLTGDGLHWAFYSGDISDAGSSTVGLQDEVIESQDYSDMENAVYITLSGYVTEDITGDTVVESLDYSIMENNVYFVIQSMHP